MDRMDDRESESLQEIPQNEARTEEEIFEALPPAHFDPLQRYLAEIGKYPLLSQEEEKTLAVLYREKGDPEAAYKLVISNLRLVVKIALEYYNSWMMNLLDLIQEGNNGLMLAVKKFDPYRGVRLPHYASFWIKAYVLRFIMENWRLVKVGTTQAQRKLFFNLKKEKKRLEGLGFSPVPKLLAQGLNVKESEVIDMDQRLVTWETSLDSSIDPDSKKSLQDLLPSDEIYLDQKMADNELKVIFNRKIEEFRRTLKGRDMDIFENRILAAIPATLHEIGSRYGISHERVRQIEKNIIKRFKEFIAQEMPDLLEGPAPTDLTLS
jgi:RNA polymerase sigma-32 factor